MKRTILAAVAAIMLPVALGVGDANAQQSAENSPLPVGFTNRIWVETKPTNGLPGVMITFLSDGTLLQDSCWETYSVSKWKRASDKKLSWDENGIKIEADVMSLTKSSLVLKIGAGRDRTEHSYAPIKAPYLCPDMKK